MSDPLGLAFHQRDSRRLLSRFFVLFVSLFLIACQDRVEQSDVSLRLEGKTMGTTWSVVFGESTPQESSAYESLQALRTRIESELERLNQLMSTWDPNSELSHFNAAESIEPIALHDDTLAVIDAARLVSQRTAGRYDITLAEVISLWGFGSSDNHVNAPESAILDQALERAGNHQLVRSAGTVRKRNPRVQLDVSSLAKGFAVDQIGHLLEAAGVEHYVAEIGGELRVRGYRSANQAWQIGVEHPDGSVDNGLALSRAHVATSGSYRNYRELDGKRVSHIIDGSTGQAISHSLVAVTVLHDSTMLADAWATALLVVGEERARKLSDEMQLSVQLIQKSGDGFSVYRSPGFVEQLIATP